MRITRNNHSELEGYNDSMQGDVAASFEMSREDLQALNQEAWLTRQFAYLLRRLHTAEEAIRFWAKKGDVTELNTYLSNYPL